MITDEDMASGVGDQNTGGAGVATSFYQPYVPPPVPKPPTPAAPAPAATQPPPMPGVSPLPPAMSTPDPLAFGPMGGNNGGYTAPPAAPPAPSNNGGYVAPPEPPPVPAAPSPPPAPAYTPPPTTADPFGASAAGLTAPGGNNAGYTPAPAAPPAPAPLPGGPLGIANTLSDQPAALPRTDPAGSAPPAAIPTVGAPPTGNNTGFTPAPAAPPAPSAGPDLSQGTLGGLGAAWAGPTGGSTGISSQDANIGQNMAPYYQALGTAAGVGYQDAASSPDGQAHVTAVGGGSRWLSNPDGTWTSQNGAAPVTTEQLKALIAQDGTAGVTFKSPSAPVVAGAGSDPQAQIAAALQGITSVGQPLAPPAPTPSVPLPTVAATDTAAGAPRTAPVGPATDAGGNAPASTAGLNLPASPAPSQGPSITESASIPTNNTLPQVAAITPSTSQAPASPASTNPGSAVNLSPTTADNALTNSTITPGAMADRQQIAKQYFDQFSQQTDPTYQAALRSATQRSAAAGGLGSGMLRTDYGNLENNRAQQLDTAKNTFLTAAENGSIDDAWKAIQLAQQQQGFQQGQQGTAFNQGVTQTQLDDNLTNSDFSRSLQQLLAGQSGDPTQTNLALSAIFGGQAGDASKALAQLLGGSAANQGASSGSGGYGDLLKALGIGQGGSNNGGGTFTNAGSAATPDDWPDFTDSPEDFF